MGGGSKQRLRGRASRRQNRRRRLQNRGFDGDRTGDGDGRSARGTTAARLLRDPEMETADRRAGQLLQGCFANRRWRRQIGRSASVGETRR